MNDIGLLALRLAIGAIFWVHGVPKKAHWKALPPGQAPDQMRPVMRILAIAEPLGALAMFAGFLTRPAAIGFGIIMLGAIHLKKNKWKMPFTAMDKLGWEFDLLILAGCVALLSMGGGSWSVDAFLGL
jgi:uncharacterized membrane protein YphA (DoxX/SURF4 family)